MKYKKFQVTQRKVGKGKQMDEKLGLMGQTKDFGIFLLW